MTERCQCDWHKLQYCWLCDDDFSAHNRDDPDCHQRDKEDAAYYADLDNGVYSENGKAADSAGWIEQMESARQDVEDELKALTRRYQLDRMPQAILVYNRL